MVLVLVEYIELYTIATTRHFILSKMCTHPLGRNRGHQVPQEFVIDETSKIYQQRAKPVT